MSTCARSGSGRTGTPAGNHPGDSSHWPRTAPGPDTDRMRLRTAAVAATSALGVGAAAVAAGRYAAEAALRPVRSGPSPGRGSLPAGFGGPPLTVHEVGDGHIALTRSLTARLPGVYGLTGRDFHAVVGPVVDAARGNPVAGTADTVVRRLLRIVHGKPPGHGAKLWLTPQVCTGGPGDDLGVERTEVEVPGELGPLPGWFVPGDRDTWVITLHGLGAGHVQALPLLPFYASQRLPVLGIAYRGDPGAPTPPGRCAPSGRHRVARRRGGGPSRRAERGGAGRPARMVRGRLHGPAGGGGAEGGTGRRPGQARRRGPDLRARARLSRTGLEGDRAGAGHLAACAASAPPAGRAGGAGTGARRSGAAGRRRGPGAPERTRPAGARAGRHRRPLGEVGGVRRRPGGARRACTWCRTPRTRRCGTRTPRRTRRSSGTS